jgi:peptidoglycan/xylan/chitin deacetylase (PgdA/CDA1 family)
MPPVGGTFCVDVFPRRRPLNGGYAAAGDSIGLEHAGQVRTTWYVPTSQPLVALTFDDGPSPEWTPLVLDTLAAKRAPATFFVVGQRLQRWSGMVAGGLDRHEIGNHTWSHADLATLDTATARAQLDRTHALIHRLTGRETRLLRPPYGHLGGAAMLAAGGFGYEVVLWSQEMHEASHRHQPAALVDAVVQGVRPGSIVLAHDVGTSDRLVALRVLGAIIDGVRRRGLRLVTVSELLAAGGTAPAGGRPAAPAHTGRGGR